MPQNPRDFSAFLGVCIAANLLANMLSRTPVEVFIEMRERVHHPSEWGWIYEQFQPKPKYPAQFQVIDSLGSYLRELGRLPASELLAEADLHGLQISFDEVSKACWSGRGEIQKKVGDPDHAPLVQRLIRHVSIWNLMELLSNFQQKGAFASQHWKRRALKELLKTRSPNMIRWGGLPALDSESLPFGYTAHPLSSFANLLDVQGDLPESLLPMMYECFLPEDGQAGHMVAIRDIHGMTAGVFLIKESKDSNYGFVLDRFIPVAQGGPGASERLDLFDALNRAYADKKGIKNILSAIKTKRAGLMASAQRESPDVHFIGFDYTKSSERDSALDTLFRNGCLPNHMQNMSRKALLRETGVDKGVRLIIDHQTAFNFR